MKDRMKAILLAVCALSLLAPAAFAHHAPNDADHGTGSYSGHERSEARHGRGWYTRWQGELRPGRPA